MGKNIFEGAKFGDRFLTKNDQVARYHGYFHGFHCLNIEGMSRHIKCFKNGKSCLTEGPVGSNWSDIISRYREPIDEVKLNKSEKEQKQIVIDKAWDYIEKNCVYYDESKGRNVCMLNKAAFYEAMED